MRVAGFDYALDEGEGKDIEAIVASIKAALENKTVVTVPVLDDKVNRMTLFINGGLVEGLVLDLGSGPRPGELAP